MAGRDKEPIRIQPVRPTAPRVEVETGEIVPPAAAVNVPSPMGEGQGEGAVPGADLPRLVGEGRGEGDWPTNKSTFEAWLKAKGINGAETRSALGTDATSWIKLNPGRTYADVAKTIAATLAK